MNRNKWIKLYILLTIAAHNPSYAIWPWEGLGNKLGNQAAKEIADSNKEVATILAYGMQNFGVEAVKVATTSIANGVAATKSAVVTVATAPATPYVVGGAVVAYGGYKGYRYMNPTMEEKAAIAESKFRDCLAQNVNTTSHMPGSCSNLAAQLSVYSGSEKVDKAMEDFRKYSKTPPNVPK